MDGILNINKPAGITSFGVVSLVKRLSRERRVGHAGTLDPAATGVLPVCFGQGTRVIEFLLDTTKSYRAEIELGVATDTYDAGGRVTQRGDYAGIDRDRLEAALASFSGPIHQLPPLYSALKYQGKPLYELARAGVPVERQSRPVMIHQLELLDWQPCSPSLVDSGRRAPVATIEVTCGKGTYIRSLAHDLGQVLGCGAHLKSLVRLRCGLFDIKEAVSLPQLDDAFRYGYWEQLLYPIDCVLSHWTAMVVNDDEAQHIKNGRSLILDTGGLKAEAGGLKQPVSAGALFQDYCRAYALDGRFLGVLRFDSEKGQWHPEKVFL